MPTCFRLGLGYVLPVFDSDTPNIYARGFMSVLYQDKRERPKDEWQHNVSAFWIRAQQQQQQDT